MKEFFISERYRLELHWGKVVYERDGTAKFTSCYFCGPVLSDIDSIQGNDMINLDFEKQYSSLITTYYIAVLSWGSIEVTPEKILLRDVIMTNRYINSVPKLHNDDYIVIDTSDHTMDKHYKNLNYKAYLLKSNGTLYNFRR